MESSKEEVTGRAIVKSRDTRSRLLSVNQPPPQQEGHHSLPPKQSRGGIPDYESYIYIYIYIYIGDF